MSEPEYTAEDIKRIAKELKKFEKPLNELKERFLTQEDKADLLWTPIGLLEYLWRKAYGRGVVTSNSGGFFKQVKK